MSRRSLAFLVLVIAFALWRPVLYPLGKAGLLLLDIYSPALVGTDIAAAITPQPLESETRESFGGVAMRVSWWRPAWGDRHPALLLVNGATPVGNDNEATRQFGRSLARAGYLVMLPEFPFTKEGRLDPAGPAIVDAAYRSLRAHEETAGQPVGAFGASVGAGVMLVASATEPGLATAPYVAVLGGYFDLDTYVASVATHRQGSPAAGLSPWEPSDEATQRIPPAVEAAMPDETDRAQARSVFTAPTYDDALARLAAISPRGRAVLDRLSPSTVWPRITTRVFWIHDPDDTYEPIAEAFAAEVASRPGQLRLVVPRLLQHAAVGTAVQGRDPLFIVGELWGLLTFTLDVLRIAG